MKEVEVGGGETFIVLPENPAGWVVVDKNGTVMHRSPTGRFFSLIVAKAEADELNQNGLPEFAPYRVEKLE